MNKIIIIDDDDVVAGVIQKKLQLAGFEALIATTGSMGRKLIETKHPDLIILDLDLPDEDGTDICRDVSSSSQLPIIILTGRAGEADRVIGLELGADDYVTKPFSLAELVARVRAVLRRSEPREGASTHSDVSILNGLGVTVNLRSHVVTVDGHVITPRPTEYKILVELMRNQGQVLSGEQILEAVWGYDAYDTHLVVEQISNLRTQVESDPTKPERIQTIRGFGYKFG